MSVLESGVSVKWVDEEYGIKQSFGYTHMAKSKLNKLTLKYSVDGSSSKFSSVAAYNIYYINL